MPSKRLDAIFVERNINDRLHYAGSVLAYQPAQDRKIKNKFICDQLFIKQS